MKSTKKIWKLMMTTRIKKYHRIKSMTDYVNPHGVRFRLVESTQDPSLIIVKYYSRERRWPQTYNTYKCSNDEHRKEMFYILNNIRFCTICTSTLLDRNDETRSVCFACSMHQFTNGFPEENIPECPVCFKKMLRVDGSRQKLACGHEICVTCTRRISRASNHVHYDMNHGPMLTCTVSCPLCRAVARYDYSFRHLPQNATI